MNEEQQVKPEPGAEELEIKDMMAQDLGAHYTENPAFHLFCQSLGVDKYQRSDLKNAQKMSFIYDWAASICGSNKRVEITQTINQIIKDLGTQLRGKSLVTLLYQHAKLAQDDKRLKRQRSDVFKQSLKESIKLGLNDLSQNYGGKQ